MKSAATATTMDREPQPKLQALLNSVVRIARSAGEAILEIYAQERFEVAHKRDRSPVTQADLRANGLILDGLRAISPLPVLTEEAAEIPYELRRDWSSYWLVDPLDGTREFVARNGEFTVNIALIADHEPVLGVVYAPALAILYAGARNCGAFRCKDGGGATPIHATRETRSPVRVVGSRSHQDADTEHYLAKLGPHTLTAIGSSLKLCLVAEGSADLYPRFSPTSEWDIAAGHAVLLAARGELRQIDGLPLRYNTKADVINPGFIAYGDTQRNWLDLGAPISA